jgi:hypothetical protein
MAENQDQIVERLTEEGLLLRNKGTNSLKSVKDRIGQLDTKFSGVLNSISMRTGETARALGSIESYLIVGNTIANEGLNELADKIDTTNDQVRDQAEDQRQQNQEDQRNERENRREGFLQNPFSAIMGDLNDLRKDIRQKPGETLFKGLKYAFLAPIIAGAVKGVLDLTFGEDWINSPIMQLVRENPAKALIGAFVAFKAVDWIAIGASITSAMVALKAMAMTGGAGGGTVVAPGAPGGPAKGGNKFMNYLRGNKGKIGLILAGTGLLIYGQDFLDSDKVENVTDELERINAEATADEQAEFDKRLTDFKGEREAYGDVLLETLTGAGIGFAAGGPMGALAGAIGGLGFSLIGKLAGYIDDRGLSLLGIEEGDTDLLPNDIEDALRRESAALNRRRNKLSAEQQAKLYKNTNEAIEAKINEIVKDTENIDTDIAALEGFDFESGVTRTAGAGRTKRTITEYDVNGEMLQRSEIEKRLQDLKDERVLREEQLVASRRLLELRQQESEAVQENITAQGEATNTVAAVADEVLKKTGTNPQIDPDTTTRERDVRTTQTGGFQFNTVNNYYNKGGDNIMTNSSDNRSNVSKNVGVVVNGGGGGGSRFSGSLPNGQSM